MTQTLESINEKFNFELWRYIKIYAFSVESVNIARLFWGTGIEVDKKLAREEVKTTLHFNDEVIFQKIIRPFSPKNHKIGVGEFIETLNPQNTLNLYSLMSENLLIEVIAIFEDYLQLLVRNVLLQKPELALSKEKQISACELLQHDNIEELRTVLIDEKIRQVMYKSIRNIIRFLSRGFQVKLDFEDKTFDNLYYWKEVRNILIHNRGIINESFLTSVRNMEVKNQYVLGERIKHSIYDVIKFAEEIKILANRIYQNITGEQAKELEKDPFQILDEEKLQKSVKKATRGNKIGRNDPCPCGSGLKYKKCCPNRNPLTGEIV